MSEPAWLPAPGSVRPRANPHKTEAELAAALVRQQTWRYREAWRRLEALRAEGPANASIWNQLADTERARGWPRRAEDTLVGAAGLDPDDTSIRLGAIDTWRELGDFPRVEPALREVEAVVPRDPQVQLARQAWDRQRGWQFELEHDRGRGGSPNFGDADHETQATLQSPLLGERWRIYGITRLAAADLPEGHTLRERLGLGLRGYARGFEAYVQALPAVGNQTRRTALEAGLRWLPDDYWTYTLDWSNTGDADVPLRAHYYDITAHSLNVSAQWRASERSAIKLSANADRYSDGNRRHGWEAAWTQRAYTAPWFSVDGGLQAGATSNSRSDVPYYSPSCARWIAATGRLENMLYERYERNWSHQLDLSFGSYDECRYGSGWMASAHYGQRWAPHAWRRQGDIALGGQRAHLLERILPAVHGQVEGAVVDRHHPAAAQVHMRLHRFGRLHVHVGPLRIVGAGFDKGHVERTQPLADRLEATEIAGVAAEEHAQIVIDDGPRSPQRLVAVEHGAFGTGVVAGSPGQPRAGRYDRALSPGGYADLAGALHDPHTNRT